MANTVPEAAMTPSTWRCGRYTVRAAMRLDSPAFPRYMVFRAGKHVGNSFSRPNESQCADIERFAKSGRYAEERPVQEYDYHLRGVAAVQRGRPTKAAVAQREAELLKVPEGE